MWSGGAMKGLHSSGETFPATDQGAVKSASMKTPPVSPTRFRTSDSASFWASIEASPIQPPFGAKAADRSSEPAGLSFCWEGPGPRSSPQQETETSPMPFQMIPQKHSYSFKDILGRSERITWRVEDLIGGAKTLDFTKPFLPESLARTAPLDFLNEDEKRVLNQIRGHAYLAI